MVVVRFAAVLNDVLAAILDTLGFAGEQGSRAWNGVGSGSDLGSTVAPGCGSAVAAGCGQQQPTGDPDGEQPTWEVPLDSLWADFVQGMEAMTSDSPTEGEKVVRDVIGDKIPVTPVDVLSNVVMRQKVAGPVGVLLDTSSAVQGAVKAANAAREHNKRNEKRGLDVVARERRKANPEASSE